MRALSAIVGIMLSLPTLLFCWIGAQTFLLWHERLLAIVLTLTSGVLLALSIALFFTPAMQRAHALLLIATLALLAIGFLLARPRNRAG